MTEKSETGLGELLVEYQNTLEKMESIAEKIVIRLRCFLIRLDFAYYEEGESLVADSDYDSMFKLLENLENAFGLEDNRSPTQVVGYNDQKYHSLLADTINEKMESTELRE